MEDQLAELSKVASFAKQVLTSPMLLNAFIIRYDSQVLHILVGSEVCFPGTLYRHEHWV